MIRFDQMTRNISNLLLEICHQPFLFFPGWLEISEKTVYFHLLAYDELEIKSIIVLFLVDVVQFHKRAWIYVHLQSSSREFLYTPTKKKKKVKFFNLGLKCSAIFLGGLPSVAWLKLQGMPRGCTCRALQVAVTGFIGIGARVINMLTSQFSVWILD